MRQTTDAAGPAPGQLHDIMGLQPRPVSYTQPILIGVGLLLLLLLAWWLFKKFNKNKELKAVEAAAREAARPIDPWMRIDQAFRQVEIREPWNRETCEEFFFQLSFLLREALELRTGLPVTGQTLAETRQSLQKSPALSANFQQELIKFLSLADQMKFAGQWLSDGEARTWRDQVKTWVEELRDGVQA